jgi:hypothetical protein
LEVTGELNAKGASHINNLVCNDSRVLNGLYFGPNAGKQRYIAPSGKDNLALVNSGLNIDGGNIVLKKGDAVVNGHMTVKNGSNFSGGRHHFRDSEIPNGPDLRVGGVFGTPGIISEANGGYGTTQLAQFTSGTDAMHSGSGIPGNMGGGAKYNYLKSHEYSLIPMNREGVSMTAQIRWNDNRLYTMSAVNGVRTNGGWNGGGTNV